MYNARRESKNDDANEDEENKTIIDSDSQQQQHIRADGGWGLRLFNGMNGLKAILVFVELYTFSFMSMFSEVPSLKGLDC